MKRIVISCSILLMLLAFGGCEAHNAGNTRDIVVNLDTTRTFSTRNVHPEGVAPLELTSYTLSGSGPRAFSFGPLTTSNSSFTLHAIPVGQWEFTAIGYNGADNPIAFGNLQTQITHQTDDLFIELTELIGNGDLALEVTWNPDQTYSDVDILLLVKDQTGAIVEELSQTAGTNDFSTTFADIDLPAGFYTLEISMSSTEEKLAALVDTALIIADTTSSATVELVVGLIADNNNFTIIDKTAKPLDGTINTDSENPSPDDTVTLTYVPILPDGATIEQLTLQWYCDGEPIVDANGATLVIENALGGTHRYDVVASIAAIGSVGSAHELVKVVVTPSIIE